MFAVENEPLYLHNADICKHPCMHTSIIHTYIYIHTGIVVKELFTCTMEMSIAAVFSLDRFMDTEGVYVCMYVRTCACLGVHVCVHVYTRTFQVLGGSFHGQGGCVCMYACMHACTYACLGVYVYVCLNKSTFHVLAASFHGQGGCVCMYMCLCMHICIWIYAPTHISRSGLFFTCVHACIYACLHI